MTDALRRLATVEAKADRNADEDFKRHEAEQMLERIDARLRALEANSKIASIRTLWSVEWMLTLVAASGA